MPAIFGIIGGAALALLQRALTARLAGYVLGARRGGVKLMLLLKLPVSLVALALIALISPRAAAFSALGYSVAAFLGAFLTYSKGD